MKERERQPTLLEDFKNIARITGLVLGVTAVPAGIMLGLDLLEPEKGALEKDFRETGGVDRTGISDGVTLFTLRKSGQRKFGSAILYHAVSKMCDPQSQCEIFKIVDKNNQLSAIIVRQK